MVGLIVDLKPMRIKKLQKKLQRDRDIASRKLQVSQEISRGIQENPIKRDKFQID